MTIDVQSFSPHLFNHYVGLERLMNGKEAITAIEAAAKDPKFINAPSTYTRYFGRWRIVWITIKYPFEVIAAVFFKALSVVLGYLTFLKSARVLSVLSKQMTRDWEQLLVQWDYNYADEKNEASKSLSPLLVPAFNAHQTTSWDLYTLGSVPNRFLTEPRVISMTHRAVNYQLGVKEAMKVFYRNLEDKPKEKDDSWFGAVSEPAPTLTKEDITKEFGKKYAVSPKDALQFLQAAFPEKETGKAIQKMYPLLKQMDLYLEQNCGNIQLLYNGLCRGACMWFINLYLKTEAKFKDPLKHLLSVAEQFKTGVPKQGALLQSLDNTDQLLKIKKTELKDLKTSLYELDCNRDSALAKIESLNDGVYRLGVLHHSLVYIKKNGSGYLWDPYLGLLATTEKQVFDLILQKYYKPGDRDSHIYFEQYKL